MYKRQQKTKATVYNTRSITGSGDTRIMDNEELAEIIQTTIEPDSWKANGGKYAIKQLPAGLVINASQPMHRKIVELMDQLTKHAQEHP